MTRVRPALPRAPEGYRTAALIALAGATFVYVTSETLPIGLLPQISAGLSVSDGQVGLLLTVYAFVAGATAIPLTAWTTRVPRHHLVLLVIAVFAVSQFAAAAAPSYAWLIAARVLCALGHGLFWSVVAPIAARLAPAGHDGRATAVVFVGNSLALVAGLPLGTVLGQLAGWRVAFAITGVSAALTLGALVRVLPPLPGDRSSGMTGALVRRLSSAPLLALYAATAVLVIGHFAAYSYLAPLAEAHGGITGGAYGALLLGYGAVGLVATIGFGRLVDSRPRLAFAAPMATIAVCAALLGLSGDNAVLAAAAVLLWGGSFASVPVMLQSAVLRVTSDRDVASAVYVVAFQIGIGGGAAIGGVLVDNGHLDAVTGIAACGAAVALAVGLAVRGPFPRRGSAHPSET